METIITKKIDNFRVVVGFDKLGLCPVGTTNARMEKYSKTKEHAEYRAVAAEIQSITPRRRGDFVDKKRWQKQYREAEEKLKKLKGRIRTVLQKIDSETVVFLESRRDEHVLPPAMIRAAMEQLQGLKKNKTVTLNSKGELEIVSDFKGCECFAIDSGRIEISRINELGIPLPVGAKLIGEMSDSEKQQYTKQQECDRVNSLSEAEAQTEKSSRIETAAAAAAALRNKLEIQDAQPADALKRAKAFYRENTKKIEAIYDKRSR